ncbi:Imm44 family immunity protein [Allohahella marinimesophila]|uniref:Uncharacterized protein n=1 Tax=Allohahella marinimesophila TaxID=1054972 RepID=A0ABP7P9Q8_9GAMM
MALLVGMALNTRAFLVEAVQSVEEGGAGLLSAHYNKLLAVQNMRFFISGELDSEIAEVFRAIRQQVEKQLNEHLAGQMYGSAIEKIALAPIIRGPRFSPASERRLVQHKSKTADYRLVIEYDRFLNGSEQVRRQLLVENLLLAVDDLGRKLGNKFEGQRLAQDISTLFRLPS